MTAEERQQLDLLGETEVYEQATKFVADHGAGPVSKTSGDTQLHYLQLLASGGSTERLLAHARHQRTRTPDGWWDGLVKSLEALRQHAVVTDLMTAYAELPNARRQAYLDQLAGHLADAFVRHLVAEALLQRGLHGR